jgi:hypothetical protein
MMRCGVRLGNVLSSVLRARARRRDVVGGEQCGWWRKRALLLAVEVAVTLVAMVMGGRLLVGSIVSGSMGWRGIIHNPVRMHLLPHRIMRPQYLIKHPIFMNSTSHPALHSMTMLMRECEANLGMMCARVVGRSGKSSVHVCVDCTRAPLGKCATMGLMARRTLLMGALVVRKLLIALEFKMAQLLMESMSILTVRRRAAVVRAYGWVGFGREGNNFAPRFIILVSPAPACQKLLYHP